MIHSLRGVRPEPFFLQASCGERFCIFHPAMGTPRGGFLYVHPFAEEMNKARRMAALQSSAFAAAGYAVLQIDLYGCGDSSGNFGEAGWESWVEDVILGMRWLRTRMAGPVGLWGLRLGGLLALDAARHAELPPDRFVLWQPVLSGEMQLTQFLRLRLAGEMMQEGSAKTGVQALRAELAAGKALEIGGYLLSPRLALPMDNLKLTDLQPSAGAVHWLEVVPDMGRGLSPAASRAAESWRQSGVQLDVQCVAGQSFWNTVETTECPALIAITSALAGERQQ